MEGIGLIINSNSNSDSDSNRRIPSHIDHTENRFETSLDIIIITES